MTDRRRHVRDSDSRGSKSTWIGVAVAVGVVVLIVGVWITARFLDGGPTTTISEDGAINIIGEDNAATDPFEVEEGWHIDWSSEGPRFSFAITGDRDFGTVIDEQGAVSGVTNPVGSGQYALKITAEGPWEVTVFPGEG